MAEKARISGRRTTKTYVYMKIGAEHMLELAKSTREGQLYTCVSSLTLAAFMVEAYFNHLGAQVDKDWEKKERKLSKLKKLEAFAKRLSPQPNLSERPFASVTKLFTFRDWMAHGRTLEEVVNAEIEYAEEIAGSLPGAEWQEFATVENASLLLSDAISVVEILHEAHDQRPKPFLDGGGGIYVAHRESKT